MKPSPPAPSRINREQQVKVVIRLKPDDPESRHPRCVHLTDQQNELLVQTDSKKQIFVFDHIAPQHSSQMDIYRMIGAEVVAHGFEGYNCCLFAYGQTGAGKTYSVMGELQQDLYSDLRGLLPRIVEDVFREAANLKTEKCLISCSFMEVYNEQIFDLLSPEKRIHQIREDFKRGVFVEGITEKRITSYRQTMELIMEGEKTRKMASTAMNNESSRSHAIFTILIETERMEGEALRLRKSKLNIVDLAGSERVKHTHVMGEQLKEGCNINKSLHVLGNVINSLVESAKKKKHIPFRDSKLTHYLKDSLGGNSITKLLANIHTSKTYLGDTLSTLMFAKRAKILKMKVEVNENVTENFDSLRKEVKRLREELAQARYFKGDTQRTERPSFEEDSEMGFEKLTENQGEVTGKSEALQAFEENEMQYKALMEVYEDHLACCSLNSGSKAKQQMSMVAEWKNLEKKNTALANLVKRFPAFTKIYKENLLLREQQRSPVPEPPKLQTHHSLSSSSSHHNCIPRSQISQIITQYESIIEEMQARFSSSLELIEKNYLELEHECRMKDKRLREFMRRQGLPPDVEDLKNENEYLQLNILNLENEICRLEEHEHKAQLERREHRRSHRKSAHEIEVPGDEEDDTMTFLMEQLKLVKEQAMKEMQQVQQQREQTDLIIEQLRRTINSLTTQNAKLQMKSSRSRSHKKREMFESRASSSHNLKTSFAELFFAEESQIMGKSQQEWQQQVKQLQDSHRAEIEQKEKELVALRSEVTETRDCQKIEQQFGKNLSQILSEYRENARRVTESRSMVEFEEYKQTHPKGDPKIQERNGKKGSLMEGRGARMKERGKREQPISARGNTKKTAQMASK